MKLEVFDDANSAARQAAAAIAADARSAIAARGRYAFAVSGAPAVETGPPNFAGTTRAEIDSVTLSASSVPVILRFPEAGLSSEFGAQLTGEKSGLGRTNSPPLAAEGAAGPTSVV